MESKTKPWTYRLPKVLQPRAGTTFAQKYKMGAQDEGKRHVGIVQAILYGVPEPKRGHKGMVLREGGVLWKVVYGNQEWVDEGGIGEEEGKSGC
jgi:hypothetical protein